MQFRNDIQGLRAIAFFLVFIFHLNKNWLPGGFLGVDLFFVISGYLVSSIILQEINHNRFNLSVFFVKRIKRIVPAYFFTLILVAIASSYFYMSSDIGTIRGTLVRASLFISNLVFANGANYFGTQMSENPLLHTWSLSLEMQFYLVLPLLLLLFRRKVKFVFAAAIVILTVYSTIQIIMYNHKNEMYFSLLARMPEFLVGGILALIFKKSLSFGFFWNNIIAALCSSVFITCTFLYTDHSSFPGFWALIPTVAAGFFLVVEDSFIHRWLSGKLLVHFGELSYSLYLLHWPIMAIIRYRTDDYLFSLPTVFFICLLTYVFASFSYYFVERKFRRYPDKKFFAIMFSFSISFLILCAIILNVSERNEIPADFASSGIGQKSHNTENPEKLGALHQNDSILLIGDSHALSLKPFLDELGKKHHFSFTTLTRNTYPALAGIKKSEIPPEKLKPIEETDSLVPLTSELIQKNSIIILTSIGFERLPSMHTAVEKIAASLRPKQKLILLSSYPVLNKNPLKLNNGFIKENSIEFEQIHNSENRDLLMDIAKKYKGVFVYDIAESAIFRGAPYINDTVFYFDSMHINGFGAKKLSRDIDKEFMKFFNEVRNKNHQSISVK